jgi:hypothetical protein
LFFTHQLAAIADEIRQRTSQVPRLPRDRRELFVFLAIELLLLIWQSGNTR